MHNDIVEKVKRSGNLKGSWKGVYICFLTGPDAPVSRVVDWGWDFLTLYKDPAAVLVPEIPHQNVA